MQQYLESTEYIDWKSPEVLAKAQSLAVGADSDEAIAEKCFIFVRDEIKHSWDYECNPVTCKASDVLRYGTGYCYAKSHLLAALLRANGIPAGLCYQRLTINHDKPPFCLHGLNAVYLKNHGWYRLDARGNKKGVSADFCPPVERLAFPIIVDGEADLPEIWSAPIMPIISVLQEKKTYKEVADNLPDIQLALIDKIRAS
ncbi:Cro/Cl family transcriptional regulator [Marinomonas piezotolerans]|uniref:Cro/Cl family transcriptional regulator n=1 Tax=Marinomonas piezotolerans TaxID=2213058 RepID=A0A370UDH1_9GAMM|nr:transglutaminase family protein [Marinomonas piezotolerans]RDL45809.1 Cro/Cl family transcriptional regulator [Marinomonas piezotolerans]